MNEKRIPRLGKVEIKPDPKKIVRYNNALKYNNIRLMMKLLSKYE